MARRSYAAIAARYPAPRGMYDGGALYRATLYRGEPVALRYAVAAVGARTWRTYRATRDEHTATRRAALRDAVRPYNATYEATGDAYAMGEGYMDALEGDTLAVGRSFVSVVVDYASRCVEAYDERGDVWRVYEGEPVAAIRDLARDLYARRNIVAPSYAV